MNLHSFLLILQARYKIALLILLATVSATLAVSLLLPKKYTATASVVVDVKSPDPVASIIMPVNIGTQVAIINSGRVAQKVVRILKLDNSPAARQKWMDATNGEGNLEVWLAELLQEELSVLTGRGESNVIEISYRGRDPAFTAAVANAFAEAYIDTNIELKVDPARQYARWYGDQGIVLRENLEKARERLSEHRKKSGIVARDEQPDTETAILTDLMRQLSIVQGQSAEALSKQKYSSSANTFPEVLQNPLIASLRSEIARQEARLQEMSRNLGTNHPSYQRMASEVATLRKQLEEETRLIASGFATSGSFSKDKEAEIKTAIAAEKKRLLVLRSERDELAVLQRDMDAARTAYDAVNKRFNQVSLESTFTQTNISLLTTATAPTEPSGRKLSRSLLIATFLGTVLGVGVAFLLEIADGRVRSANDLAEMLQLPLLGVIERASYGNQRRVALWRRDRALTIR